MSRAKTIAPEIDRLVLGVNWHARQERGSRYTEMAQEIGLQSVDILRRYADFLLDGIDQETAQIRLPYQPEGTVENLLDELAERDLIDEGANGLVATPPLRPLLEAIVEGRAAHAERFWTGHETALTQATEIAGLVIASIGDEYRVAVAHRGLPDPANPYALGHKRVTTIRYARAHAHRESWLRRDLTAPQILALSSLWRHENADISETVLGELATLGFVEEDQLTQVGRGTREAIEADTNRLTEPIFDVLSDRQFEDLMAALGDLPGSRGV
jgi:hypothetical protein